MATKMNNIFFSTDFSDNANRALPFAAEIAVKTESNLILFHASQGALDFAPNFEKTREEAVNEAGRQFDKLLAELEKDDRYADLEVRTILQSGHPIVGLLEQSTKNNSDLIVMGTKGATGDRNVIFGSVASSVINKSDIPVLTVPAGSQLGDLKHIAFTTDYHEDDLDALKQTVDFAELFESSIDVIHVAEERNLLSEIKFRGFRELFKDQIDFEDITFAIRYDYDFFPVMADYLIDNPNTLLVMVRYKKTFWEKMAESAHSRDMAFYSRVPLLVLMGK